MLLDHCDERSGMECCGTVSIQLRQMQERHGRNDYGRRTKPLRSIKLPQERPRQQTDCSIIRLLIRFDYSMTRRRALLCSGEGFTDINR
jgi:hypothetical protein